MISALYLFFFSILFDVDELCEADWEREQPNLQKPSAVMASLSLWPTSLSNHRKHFQNFFFPRARRFPHITGTQHHLMRTRQPMKANNITLPRLLLPIMPFDSQTYTSKYAQMSIIRDQWV